MVGRVTGIGVAIEGISIGISGPLAEEMAVGGDGNALGDGIESLGDGVQSGAGAEGDSGGVGVSSVAISTVGRVTGIGVTVVSISIGISGPLAEEMTVGGDGNALGHGIESLGDGVQSGAGAEGNSGGVGVSSVGISSESMSSISVGGIVGISLGLSPDGRNKTSLNKKMIISKGSRKKVFFLVVGPLRGGWG